MFHHPRDDTPHERWQTLQGAPTGSELHAKGWRQEAAYRLLNNNLDPEVGEDPESLVVYGGTGRAARSWDAYGAICSELLELDDDETLLVQSGKPVGRFRTHERAPRVLIANSNLVGKWDNWDHFHELEEEGLMMYGQMTAGSWAYIGTQGIIQGTYETLAECANDHFDGTLEGRVVVTAGLGGMGGAQPLAVTMNRGVCIAAEVDEDRIDRRIETGYCQEKTDDVDEAIRKAEEAAAAGEPYSVGVHLNAADLFEALLEREFVPDVVTDQTSAHDPLEGYYPSGYTVEEADALREEDPEGYRAESLETMERHVDGILELQERGAIAFEYGNNIRGEVEAHRDPRRPVGAHRNAGRRAGRVRLPGFVPAYIRPMFCRGQGPFRWLALSGEEADIHRTDAAVKELFPRKTGSRAGSNSPRSKSSSGPPGPRLLARLRDQRRGADRTGAVRAPHQRTGARRRDYRAYRRDPRPPRRGVGRLAEPRDGGDAGRDGRGRRLADPERAAELRGRGRHRQRPRRRRRRHRQRRSHEQPRRPRRHRPGGRDGEARLHHGPRHGRRPPRRRRVRGRHRRSEPLGRTRPDARQMTRQHAYPTGDRTESRP